ncbi:MAG: hypothetical protein OXC44_07365 [Proteobacteria bacterium]|nr:hypothetical protein [Pseudomonadota bacterium]
MKEASNIFNRYKKWKSSRKQKLQAFEQQFNVATKERILSRMKDVKSVIRHAQNKNFNEANTVKIVQDICEHLLGYHKHYDIEMEYLISGKRCDMAIIIGKKLKCLVEIKAIRIQNLDKYIDQAVQYGVETRTHCVVLTNARIWYVFWLNHEHPSTVVYNLIFTFDILNDRASKTADYFQNLSKEHITKFIEDGIANNKKNVVIEEKSWPNAFIDILTQVGLAIAYAVIDEKIKTKRNFKYLRRGTFSEKRRYTKKKVYSQKPPKN